MIESGRNVTQESKDLMMSAAWDIVVESFGFETHGERRRYEAKILEQLRAADVAARAGLTTGAFYNRWPNREAFLEDFLGYALSPDRSPTMETVLATFGEIQDLPLAEQVKRLAVVDIETISSNPAFAIQTHLWSIMRGRPDIGVLMQEMYSAFRTPIIPVYEAMLSSMDRELRPPFTMAQLSNTLVALAEGLTMQVVAGGEEAPDPELMAWAIMSILPTMTRRIGETEDLHEMFSREMT